MIEIFTLVTGFFALLSILIKIRLTTKVKFFWFVIFLIIIFDGLRWEMGTDWASYYAHFSVVKDFNQPGFDLGFIWYTRLIRNITDNYSIYLFITTAIIYIGIFYVIFKITNRSLLALFYLIGTIPWYSGSLRQMLACVFFCFALKAVIDRKPISFVLLIILGLFFHPTMIVFLPIYWLYGLTSGSFLFLFLFLSLLSIFSDKLLYVLNKIMKVFFLNRDFTIRLGGRSQFSNPILGFARKLYTLSGYLFFSNIVLSMRNKYDSDNKKIKFFLFLSSLSLIFYYIGTYRIMYVSSRLDIYTGIISASVLIGLLDTSLKRRSTRIFLFLFVCSLVFVFYYRLLWLDLFHPYSSIFYNFNLNRVLH